MLTPTTVFTVFLPTKSIVVNFDGEVKVRECVYTKARGVTGWGWGEGRFSCEFSERQLITAVAMNPQTHANFNL